MFEQIHFFRYEGLYHSKDIAIDDHNNNMQNTMNFLQSEDEDYTIDGSTWFLFSHPISEERKQHLMYLQSFCYMNSGMDYFTKRKNCKSYLLLYCYEGHGKLIYEDKEYVIEKNDGFLIDCSKLHIYKTEGNLWVHSDLNFNGGIAKYYYEENFSGRSPVFHCSQPSVFQAELEKILRMQNSISSQRDFEFSKEMEELLFMVLKFVNDDYPGDELPENIRILQNYLEHNFIKEINLDEMAEFSGISKYHLCRQFRRFTGFSPIEYRNHLRILQAKVMLDTTNLPSYRIGMLSGFRNEANFIRHFKAETGKTPGEYRSNSGM